MAARLETTSPLGRKLFIEVPADKIMAEEQKQIEKLMRTAKIHGFRQGKIPKKVIQERYGDGVYAQVINEAIDESLKAAFAEHNLQPAGAPRIENLQMAKQEPIRYEVLFDIYPEVTVSDLGKISVERRTVVISDENVDEVIERLRKQQSDWSLVDRKAEEGDKLFLDVKVDVEGGSIKDMNRLPTELGSKTMIPGFEEGLIGKKAGDEVVLNLTFPDPYFDANIAGKPAKFTVQVLEVLAATLPSDEELAKKMGSEDGVNGLKESVREHLQREANQLIKTELKNQLWEKLIEDSKFDLPASLIEQELHHVLHPHQPNNDFHHHPDATDDQRQEAEKRVRMRLLLGEVIKNYQIKLDVDKLRNKITEIVSVYENPSEMAKQYYQSQEFLMQLQATVLEEQTVDELLKHVQIIDKEVSYNEMFKK